MVTNDCIAFYLNNGYVLIPLDGKIPLVKKWQNTRYDPLFDCAGNFGVVLQDDDVVVDIDPRNGGVIPSFLAGVNTLVVKTGGGGWHYYFKKASSVDIVNGLKAFPGVEFKTKGHQVVGAGSVTQAEYTIVNPSSVAQCPFLDIITRREKQIQKTDKKIEYTNDAQTQSRFVDFLSHCQVAITGQNGDATTYSVACHGRDLGLDEDTTSKLMALHYNQRCLPPWPVEEMIIKINNAYKYAQNDPGALSPTADFDVIDKEAGVSGWEYIGKEKTKLKDSFRNTLNTLLLPNSEISGLFRFNEFSEEIEFTRESPWHKCAKDSKIWSDNDAIMLKSWISHYKNFAPSIPFVHEACLVASKKRSYHPLRDYLQSLKWDGVERIGTWLNSYLKVERSEYTDTIGQIVLCAAVKRIFNPGEKFDYLMVLEGAQRIGKSRVCEALGGEYHIGLRLDPHNKDMIAYMQSKWIVEIEEMDFATKSEAKAIKAFLSRRTDRVRSAYARVTRDFPRQSIFIGTYNPMDGESQYLNDPTGNTRFWPVSVPEHKIDVERLLADRDQLWAEAVVKAKDCWLFLNPELEKTLSGIQHLKKETDPWFDLVEPWLKHNVKEGSFVNGLTIYTQCIGGVSDTFSYTQARRIGSILNHLEWPKAARWDKEKLNSERGWQKPLTKDLTSSDLSDIF